MVTCSICHHKKARLSFLKNNYQYYSCPKCKTFFIYPFPKKKELSIYYKKFTNSAISQERTIRKRSIRIINQLKKLSPCGKDLIDIGCGYGFLLDEARKKGLSVIGVEPSISAFKYFKNILKINGSNSNFEEFIKINRKKFDFVIFSHVIEHIKNPKNVISQLSKLLKVNGILYIETPNINSHLFYEEKENYTFLLPPEHLWLFSLNSFSYTIPSNLSMVKVNTTSQTEHFMGILKNKFKRHLLIDIVQTTKKTQGQIQKPTTILKKIKYLLLDKILAPLLTPLLNKNNLGSILQIYLRKK